MTSKATPMGTGQIEAALAHRYRGNAWALFFEAHSGAADESRARSADALAMSLWPSRGLELHGHEIKASRGDWLAELRQPEKAEEICRFCDRWWLVVGDPRIVKDGELPPTWGLLVPHGKRLRVKVDAPKLTPEPATRLFLAALMRSVSKSQASNAVLKACAEESYAKGQRHAQAQHDRDIQEMGRIRQSAIAEAMAAKRAVEEFNTTSGLNIETWNAGKIGDDVRQFTLARHELDRAVKAAGKMADMLAERSTGLRKTESALRQIVEDAGFTFTTEQGT